VPKRKAIDLINGTTCAFVGDKELILDDFTRNFHIQPSRTIHRIDSLHFEQRHLKNFSFAGRKVLLIDTLADVPGYRQSFDIVVLSKNPRLYIPKLVKQLNFRQLVIDGSVPQWKARLWKKDCTELGIPCHDVSDKGAYVLDL
jgi:competence protein ComEC